MSRRKGPKLGEDLPIAVEVAADRDPAYEDSAQIRRLLDDPHTVENLVRVMVERSLPAPRGGPVTWLWILSLPIFVIVAFASMMSGEWSIFLAAALGLATSRLVAKQSAIAAESRSALLLSDLGPKWFGPIVDALAWPSGAVRNVARARLISLLPTFEAESTPLTPGRRALLYDHLTAWGAFTSPDLAVAILRFGASTGDEQALAGASRLAVCLPVTSSLRRVRMAARQQLPRIERMIAENLRAERRRAAAVTLLGQNGSAASSMEQKSDSDLHGRARSWAKVLEEESGGSPGMRIGFLVAVWSIVLPYGLYQAIRCAVLGEWLFALLFLVGSALVSQAHRFTLTPRQARIASKLASVEDVYAIGPLIEMTSWPDARIQSMATAALIRLLPRLLPSDTGVMTSKHRASLYQSLKLANSDKSAEFIMSVLKALEQVGDLDAIPFVRQLAGSQATNVRQQRVVMAAADCLPFLEGCAQQNRDSQILLRATAVEGFEEDRLLRPAASTAPDPERLVRVAPSVPES